jgi:integrase/recombinase XerD
MDNPRLPTTWYEDHDILMPRQPNKDEKSRIGYFIDWLAWTGRSWIAPDLRAYRDYLLHERTKIDPPTGNTVSATLAPRTVVAHLSTIRGRYDALLRDNNVRDSLYAFAPQTASPADKKAFVDEILTRIQNAVHPTTAAVDVITRQDIADSDYLRLKPHQARALLRTPGIRDAPGMRDTAMIALMVCTGIREAELIDLNVDDMRQTIGGELALRIRAGKGGKQRMIPYGPMDWCLLYVERWLDLAEITSGAVFRGFYKGNKTVRKTRITLRAVNLILNKYPIMIDGELRAVKPHDLRRTYARNAYENGMDMERIRQNLGHVSLQTTQTYIGALDAEQRRPPLMFDPPHRLELLRSQTAKE